MNKLAVLLLCVSVAVATPLTKVKTGRQTKAGTLLQTLEEAGCFVMVDLYTQANYLDVLTGTDVYTVFAPEDASFDQALLDSLLADTDLLTNFLNYHMVAASVTSDALQNDVTVATVQGSTIRTNIYGQIVTINGASVTTADLMADNGVVHVISRPNQIPAGNIPEVLTADAEGRFTTLLTAVGVAGLGETLSGEGPFTLFAPTNAAFDALPEGVLDSLLADPEALGQVLLGHVVASTVFGAGVTSGEVPTAAGDNIIIVVSANGITVDGANVIEADLVAFNGVVHVIDAVI
ncbi:protein sll1483-like [Artemia franciscana]|uniref:protein sll1483-like n=1 Tax=Artemia franciscana TaxID=6661 RepID=UPI0032DB2C4D